uniref:Trk system potassium transporter TrkA n=1 Tax=Geoglobus ahangari TaxID=113653 RepID=A0A7C3YG80_9EURY
MKIIIAGAGEVGYNIAKNLADKHDITIIESDEKKISEIEKLNVSVVRGNAANVKVLKRAGVENADLLIAVTGNDEVNLLAGLAAKKLGVGMVIVRVGNPEYANKPVEKNHPMGYDVLICPQLVLASEFAKLVTIPGSIEFSELGELELVEIAVREDSQVVSKKIKEIKLPRDVIIAAIYRDDRIIVPRGDTVIKANDKLAVLGRRDSIKVLREVIGEPVIKNVIIAGAGTVGIYTAKLLERANLNIKLIEKDEKRAEKALNQLKRTKVVIGDATDIDLLREEEVEKADVVIATTESDEKNLLIALLSKSLGAGKAFVRVEKKDYVRIFEQVGVDAALSPRKSTYLEVMRILQLTKAVGEMKEGIVVIEVECNVNKKVSQIKLPENTIIAVVKRNREMFVARGDTELRKGDILYVLTTWDKVDEVEKRLKE